MKGWRKICIASFLFCFIILMAFQLLYPYYLGKSSKKEYEVDLNRIYYEIQTLVDETETELDIGRLIYGYPYTRYTTIKGISTLPRNADTDHIVSFYKSSNYDYRIYPLISDGEVLSYIRIDYDSQVVTSGNDLRYLVSMLLILISIGYLGMLAYLTKEVLLPFAKIKELPHDLAKGTMKKEVLRHHLKESKGRYFGKFIWGLGVLGETLEANEDKRLALEKEKKLMILSISHDMKTPLSAIRLYAKALSTNIYQDEEKKKEITYKIEEKVKEMEHFLASIVTQTSTDIISTQVSMEEFYLFDLIGQIKMDYQECLSLLKTDFMIEQCANCILKGDLLHLRESISNVIENSIKYGDGKSIGISFDTEEDCQLISITNRGNTLPETELLSIFDSFYRGSNAMDKPGSGLGLYISKQIMIKMNGDIYAKIMEDEFIVTFVIPRA